MKLIRLLKTIFNRWKYTGTLRRPKPLTESQLLELSKLLTKNKPNQ